MAEQKPKKIKWDWRQDISDTVLDQGAKDVKNGKVEILEVDEGGSWVKGRTGGGFYPIVFGIPTTYRECRDFHYYEWAHQSSPGRRRRRSSYGIFYYEDRWEEPVRYHTCTCVQGGNGTFCRHLAGLMIAWEQKHGPFTYTETEEERAARVQEEEEERARLRLKKEKEKKQKEVFLAIPYLRQVQPSLPRTDAETVFSPEKIFADVRTDRYESDQFEAFSEEGRLPAVDFETDYVAGGDQVLLATAQVENHEVRLKLGKSNLLEARCECGRTRAASPTAWQEKHRQAFFCCHALAACRAAWRKIAEENPGDETDRKGDQFLKTLVGAARPDSAFAAASGDGFDQLAFQKARQKAPVIVLAPRITPSRADDGLQLSFTAGRLGGRPYVLRGLEKFCKAAASEGQFALSKKETLDFSVEDLTPASSKWFDFIRSRMRAIETINNILDRGSNYWYQNTRHLEMGAGIPLDGSDLDMVYTVAEGTDLVVQRGGKASDGEYSVHVGPAVLRVRLTLFPVKSKGGSLQAVDVAMDFPRTMQGSQYRYILDDHQFGRVSDKEVEALRPFLELSRNTGAFQCRIGQKKFAELFYRVLPSLKESGHVEIVDQVGEVESAYLPPEPEFSFFLDFDKEGGILSCRAFVSYGEEGASWSLGSGQRIPAASPLPPMASGNLLSGEEKAGDLDGENPARTSLAEGAGAGQAPAGGPLMRDADQEARVAKAVGDYFGNYDAAPDAWTMQASDEAFLAILAEGVAVLSEYGTVHGTDAFFAVRLYPAPRPSFQVSLESGLLDLSIRTKDLDAEELLDLLASYRKRKRWHRLRSGSFVDLRDSGIFDDLDRLAGDLDLSIEDLARGRARIPEYRALYLDALLQDHEEIASSRDRHFKGLVRSFRTIRDADFEAPRELEEILRPYQTHGFRWLSTLAQAGFGGILADEMGLGKTLQMLAFLKSRYDAGEKRPALVVCPASLVYNWKEEAGRFVPDLPACPVAGGVAARKRLLTALSASRQASEEEKGEGDGKAAPAPGRPWLIITSYDLLKRDIALYKELDFSTVVLDEAQFVKNQKASVTKAVKILRAGHRFALTGTPIENRLSELWSIFDFLMPGFLYTATEFSARFESPIMKQNDQASASRLASMTAPFILRRRKADVLADLPDKLEETRSTQMEGEQRKLYDAQVVHMKKMLASYEGSGEDKLRILAEITRLRQICCDPSLLFEDYRAGSAKREACLDIVKSAIDGGHRMLIFSQFTTMIALLQADLQKEGIPFYTITGATPKQDRLRLVNEFNEGDVPVFLISLRAGGTGLNLVGADVVIHYDPWWNLAVQNQATDRAHRIGQTRQVTVLRLIAADSIEDKIVALQEKKRDLADAIIGADNTSLMSLSREELLALLS